jgi:uncharacterized membrane protein
MDWWLIFFWSGPIGVGFFLVCLGIFIWLVGNSKKETSWKKREKKE